MPTRTVRWMRILLSSALAMGAMGAAQVRADAARRPEGRPFKVLHVMSYHSPWRWSDGQFQGFREGVGDLPVEYQVFQLDTKRKSTAAEKEKAGREARALLERWKPDLLYTSDDDAQKDVAMHYVGSDLPIVFSGVNEDPKVYGFVGSRNVAGVLEQEHFAESVQLLRKIAPRARRIAVVFDDAAMWGPVRERMKAAATALPGVEIGPWDTLRTFEDYKRRVREYQRQVDAIALIGIFNFKDDRGKDVPYQDVLRWTAENSALPDLSFWGDRVHFGTLCAVTVSEREQGLAAGRMARAILAEGRSPSSFPMKPTVKGQPFVSLARASRLGLMPTTSVLLSTEVVRKFDWEKE